MDNNNRYLYIQDMLLSAFLNYAIVENLEIIYLGQVEDSRR